MVAGVSSVAPAGPALRYYGGKWKLAPWIIAHFPRHADYIEPCGGGASVLLQKPRAGLETYNDLDGDVVNFFRVLRDEPDTLIEKIRLTPWARAEFEAARVSDGDSIERARRFFVSAWMSISGAAHEKSTGWRSSSYLNQSYSPHLLQYQFCKSILRDVSDRLLGVQIENADALYVIERYGSQADALIYFDPPYVPETRVNPNQYRLEVTLDWHVRAAELLRARPGFVVVSGYACDLYADLYEAHGWRRVDVEAQVNTGSKRIESLWLNPLTARALSAPVQGVML